ncbi:MAG: hypothetical protein QF464_12560, partial [Myxococcota bacterium]|nr:hypothetical protein [Myxococcota bacterium]
MRPHLTPALLPLLLATLLALLPACSGGDSGGPIGDDTEIDAAGDDDGTGGSADGAGGSADGAGGSVDGTGGGDSSTSGGDTDGPGPDEDDGTTTSPDTVDGPVEPGCSPVEATAVITMEDDVVPGCMEGCLFAGDPGQCTSACVAEALGVSEACGACFGDLATCTMSQCATECAGGGAGCDACVEANCMPELLDCVGLEPPQVKNSCANPDDAIVAEMALGLMFDQCAPPCLSTDDPGACLEECADDAGFSAPCADCFGDFGTCTSDLCGDVCTQEVVESDDTELCDACIAEYNCTTDLVACSGLALFGEEPPPAPAGFCMNPEDGALLESPEDPAGQCWQTCIPQEDTGTCMASCLEGEGFSIPCSDCMAVFGDCVADYCEEECDGATPEACDACVSTACGLYWNMCFAWEAPNPEPGPDAGLCVNPEDQAIMDTGA